MQPSNRGILFETDPRALCLGGGGDRLRVMFETDPPDHFKETIVVLLRLRIKKDSVKIDKGAVMEASCQKSVLIRS